MTPDLLSPAAALDHLLGAHASVGEAAAAARRSLAVGWESPAADGFRAGVSALLVALEGDLRVLGEAVAVVRS
ncbi:hypothetical protein [Isoptericola cucumis]|uniref:Uncharacterized protein n=1 Tax=Isoptericola cucumis TaxID=1776856 RepID=A0ABQ2BCX1_9MICO|nr:hypothetical protein [Isoptericola cucumis]GGI11698.1 hypothetical protein GCM10007368_37490 [Isoptericola cucumis]